MAGQQGLGVPPAVVGALPGARATLAQSGLPSAQALLLLGAQQGDRTADAERILESVRAEMPTLDRALALIWVNKVLKGKLGDAGNVALKRPWRHVTNLTGATIWYYGGSRVPRELDLVHAPAKPLTAFVQYESTQGAHSRLAVQVQRKLYHLVSKEGASKEAGGPQNFDMTPVGDNEEIQANDLYLEEITLTPENGAHVRYGIVEAPLPPGAGVEATTWGVTLPNGVTLERSVSQPTSGGYAVPVEDLGQPITLRHLLRFAQKGQYKLPPARFYSMYAPDAVALQDSASLHLVKVK
jgi:uncharacterized protein YfaS (alpha-2-macroglobulin family)